MIGVFVYGAGNEYNKFVCLLNLYKNQIHVLGLVTTNAMKYNMLDGYRLYRPEQILDEKFDYIIIAVKEWKPVADVLLRYGIEKKEF